MSIDFTNVEKLISDELVYILDEEFGNVVFEDAFQLQQLAETGEYLRVWPGTSDLVSHNSDGETRDYLYQVVHYFDQDRYRKQKDWNEIYSEKMAIFRRLVRDNHYHKVDHDYYWHNLSLQDSSPPTWIGEFEDIGDETYDGKYGIVHNLVITRSNF